MKNIIIITSLFIANNCYSQITGAELKSGKYFENKHKNDFIGEWKCVACTDSFKISVETYKRNIKGGIELNISADFLEVKIVKKFHKRIDISKQFVKPIELLSINNDNKFSGSYYDPVTKSNIKIKITKLSNGNLSFDTSLPEMDVTNDNSRGTIFSKNLILSKKFN